MLNKSLMVVVVILGVITLLTGCNERDKVATKETPHIMECYRVDRSLNPLTIYRCENDEAVCYARSFSDAGMECNFKMRNK